MRWNTSWINRIWYDDVPPPWWLRLLSHLYRLLLFLEKLSFRCGFRRSVKLPVPIVVVGNITVGGTGKTPLVIALVEKLRNCGWKPGVISRGYGGTEKGPYLLDNQSEPRTVGDEPCLIYQQTQVPVAIGRNRVAVARLLLDETDVDVIIADDGLQHWQLIGNVEICVLDGQRRFGNGKLFPAGPLRESIDRLENIDFIICNGGQAQNREIPMRLTGDQAINLFNPKIYRPLRDFSGQKIHAFAGIGHPERFLQHLISYELDVNFYSFPDHYAFCEKDIRFNDDSPVFMTEKDAVKCRRFAGTEHWYMPVRAKLPDVFYESIFKILDG